MTRPYSVDLRERVVGQVEAGDSVRRVAAMFAVSPSFMVKLVQVWRRRGTVAALDGDRAASRMAAATGRRDAGPDPRRDPRAARRARVSSGGFDNLAVL